MDIGLKYTIATDHDILYAIRGQLYPLSPTGKGGAHTQVYRIGFELADILAQTAMERGIDEEGQKRAWNLGKYISSRFLVKVGNIKWFRMKLLNGKREAVIPRHLVSEAFGPVGYNLAPTIDKVEQDTRDAVRMIPYFGYGSLKRQFAPDILAMIRMVVNTGMYNPEIDSTFLVVENSRHREKRTAFSILADDPYFQGNVKDFTQLVKFQEHVRANPLNSVMRERLRAFFDAPITIGFRDTLRFLQGSRHPRIGWNIAEDVIQSCFAKWSNENFLPPEINYYTYSIEISSSEVNQISAKNSEAIKAFGMWMIEKMPLSWTAQLTDDEIYEIASSILSIHFDYPIYEIEPYTGVFSSASFGLALRFILNLGIHLSGIDVPERRNPIKPENIKRAKALYSFLSKLSQEEQSDFINIVNTMLWEVAIRGGVPTRIGITLPYIRINKTFYSFQERAQYEVEKEGEVHEVLTLEDLAKNGSNAFFEAHPSIAEKLTVFFTMVYRYFIDSGHVVDLRPDDAGKDLFIKGIWGYSTQNVIIVTGRKKDGSKIETVRFVDNKDQFKEYRRIEDRARPVGFAKHGLRLVHQLVEPAMQRSIGIYTQLSARHMGKYQVVPKRVAKFVNHLLTTALEGGIGYLDALGHDLIDDTTDTIERWVSKIIK